MSIDLSATVAATDDLIRILRHRQTKENSNYFIGKLEELRLQHKETLKLLEELYTYHTYDDNQKLSKRSASQPRYGRTDSCSSDSSCDGSYFSDPYFEYDFTSMEDLIKSAREKLIDEHAKFTVRQHPTHPDRQAKLSVQSVTIPHPFAMTIRDELIPIKSTYSQKFLERLLEEEQHRWNELQSYQFKANPVPSSTYMPLYQELVAKMENRRKFVREYAKQMLRDMQQPFKLSGTSRGLHHQKCNSFNFTEPEEPIKVTEALPLPSEILTAEYAGELKRIEAERLLQSRERALRLAREASWPSGMSVKSKAQTMKQFKRSKHWEMCMFHPTFKPEHANTKVPDFRYLHYQFALMIAQAKAKNRTTVCEPFALNAEERIKKRIRSRSREQHKHEVKIRHMRRSRSDTRFAPEIKKNLATKLRDESIKQYYGAIQAEAIKRMVVEERRQSNAEHTKQRLLQLSDISQQPAEIRRKLKELKRQAKERESDYRNQLLEMEEKLEERPTLLERQMMRIRQQCIENKFSKTFQSLGIDEKQLKMVAFVPQTVPVPAAQSEKGSTKTPKSSSSSAQTRRSSSSSTLANNKANAELIESPSDSEKVSLVSANESQADEQQDQESVKSSENSKSKASNDAASEEEHENTIPKADLESEYESKASSSQAEPIRQNGDKNANGKNHEADNRSNHDADSNRKEGSNNAAPAVPKSDDFYD